MDDGNLIMNKDYIRTQLNRTQEQLDLQMTRVEVEAAKRGLYSYEIQDSSGRPLMTDLLVAKANVLRAMIDLENL